LEIENLEKEMNRGFLQLVILLLLERPMYGYMMMKLMEEKGAAIDESTLYPLMRRLEAQGLLFSRWDTSENKARKYYEVTDEGRQVREKLSQIVSKQSLILEYLKGENENV
jgi:PadR family transcriptional regulator PadR